MIELCRPASLFAPREPVLLLCTVPPLKPEEVKKNIMQKNEFAVQSGVFKQIPEWQPHLPWVKIRYVLQEGTEAGWRTRTVGHLCVRLASVSKNEVGYEWTAQPLCKTCLFLMEAVLLVFADIKWKGHRRCRPASLAHCNWLSCCFEQGPKRLFQVKSMQNYLNLLWVIPRKKQQRRKQRAARRGILRQSSCLLQSSKLAATSGARCARRGSWYQQQHNCGSLGKP